MSLQMIMDKPKLFGLILTNLKMEIKKGESYKDSPMVRVSFKGFKKLQMQKRYSDVGNQYFTFFMQEKSFGEFLA